MKRVLLLVSHTGSGSNALVNVLNHNPRIQFHNTDLVYKHPEVLDILTANPHKCNTTAATWAEEILYNYQFSCKPLYKMCKFIYLVRDAKYLGANDFLYYCYRLRRICEMARQTPGSFLMTWEDLSTERCFPMLEKFLCLRQPLERGLIMKDASKGLLNPHLVDQAQKTYERYLHFLRNGCQLQWDFCFSSVS
jgi:hypothetical protein